MNPIRRSTTEILSRQGGIFWGLVLLVLGVIAFLSYVGYLQANLGAAVAIVAIMGGIWLIVTKMFPEKFE